MAVVPRRDGGLMTIPRERWSRALPGLMLAGLVALALLGWWLFPHVQAYVAFQDCVAAGRTDCMPHEPPGT